MCENLSVKNINVRNPWYAQNGDGIDIESCKNGIVTGCTFDVGDDAICIKSGKDEEGRKRGIPTENFIVENCVVYHGHGGFTIGSEMSGGVRNMLVKDCTFLGTDIGLRFKSTRGRGGVVEDIFISGIDMINIPAQAIDFNLYYGGTSPVPDADEVVRNEVVKSAPVNKVADETTPAFRNISMTDITCNGAAQAIRIQGLPEMYVSGLTFENIKMKSATGVELICVENSLFKNVSIETSDSDGFKSSESKSVEFLGTVINGKKIE
jgi:polygalacturonase